MNVSRVAKIDGDRATGARQVQCGVHRLALNRPRRMKLRDVVRTSEAGKLHPQEGEARAATIPRVQLPRASARACAELNPSCATTLRPGPVQPQSVIGRPR